MKWKIYLLFYSILFISGILSDLDRISNFNISAIFRNISYTISLMGLYSYVFKKNFLSYSTWKILFWISIITFIIVLILPNSLDQLKQIEQLKNIPFYKVIIALLFTLLVITPAYFALFKLAYPKKDIKVSKKKQNRL